ncbi:hypothetical protein HJG60_009400 [Phyllostomus discolor]|uniref:Uncharacterized protein n=1 Tax=Phyllostomus discolor TaxID=89673 RepID=A0A833YJN2_9CHIR|nr:hypothetical protein HJG60_009400 [Phyllostomus discolor]
MYPDWESNLGHFGSQPTLNPPSYASQVMRVFSYEPLRPSHPAPQSPPSLSPPVTAVSLFPVPMGLSPLCQFILFVSCHLLALTLRRGVSGGVGPNAACQGGPARDRGSAPSPRTAGAPSSRTCHAGERVLPALLVQSPRVLQFLPGNRRSAPPPPHTHTPGAQSRGVASPGDDTDAPGGNVHLPKT